MKNITKTIITTVLLLLTVGLFAQDSTKSQFITDRQTYIPNLWPNEQKTSKDKQRQTELDYIAKAKKIDPMQKWLTGYSFVHRLNINELDKFDELGVRRDYILAAHGTSYKEHALQAQVIVVGTIEDITILDEKEYYDNIVYKIKIDELVAGVKYLIPKAEYVYISAQRGEDIYLKKTAEKVKIGEKGLFFLTKAYWFDFIPHRALGKDQKINDIIYKSDAFLPVSFSTIRINGDNTLEDTNYDAKPLPKVFDGKTQRNRVAITLDQIIKEIKQIYETNDTYNFFNREYR